MIESIELKNWKTHGSTKLSFSKGTNILIGQMGAGKSSIMDAISFALFGTFPAAQHRRVNMGKLIRNKPSQERSGFVKLAFTVDNNEYVVTRELSLKGASVAKLERNGSYLQSQPERVTEEIEKALKVDYDLFSKAIYSEQNGLDYFLGLSAGDRKKQIDRLLGLDRFALAQENCTALINKLKDMAEEGESAVEGFDLGKANAQLAQLMAEMERYSKDKGQLDSQIKKLEQESSAVQEKLTKLKNDYRKKIELGREIAELKSRSNTLQQEIKKIEKQKPGTKGEAKKKFDEANERLTKLAYEEKNATESERKANMKLARLQSDSEKLNADLKERERLSSEIKGKSSKEIDQKIAQCMKETEELSKQAAALNASKAEADKWIKELEKHVSKCPVCERELPAEMLSKLIEGKKAMAHGAILEIKKIDELNQKKRLEINGLNKELNLLSVAEERLKGYSELDSRLASVKKELDKASSEAKDSRATKESAAESVSKARDEIAKSKSVLELATRMEEHTAEKEKSDRSAGEKQAEHDKINADEKSIEAMQAESTEASSQLSRKKAESDAITLYIKDKMAQAKDKETQIESINKVYTDIKKKKVLIENLAKFRGSLEETQAVMRNRLVASINSTLAGLWPELYPYGDYTGLVLQANEDDYSLRVKTLVNNELSWEEVDSVASGGERSTASLAMRIAFALVLVPNLKWLILDEPTHNIDQQGLEKFIYLFNDVLPKTIDQVFIITHDDMLKQVQNARIFMLNRNKEENKETEVAEA